ncbi:4a-hydroxytetrahydrobiopterin dehydratase [Sporothrix schenckii 1099-18]|uniref:4a-hydroxytetrahydrobiopterin dehydratase n=1 Tax=Sporothrix schenckii 1099-18 TaxID=1397361 RepID=A0A0F2LYF0_SPOSC|nr:4a-hydroxytetrahydrobiopterin dehydratase [Sporothrix schenckii 1099-18]KJR82473.1 4a-hydroxytetrahydrobiopterin dehydratase [Sporothrix schenckii 1099-18]
MTGARHPQIVGKTEADETAVRTALETLVAVDGAAQSPGAGRWAVTANGLGIERSFKFKNFTKTWDFMTAVALQSKLKNHHPEWSNVYNTTFIRWTTHNPGPGLAPGLTVEDTELAVLCDELARAFGEVAEAPAPEAKEAKPANATTAEPTSVDNAADTLSSLADSAAGVASCDCTTRS